MPDSGKFCVSLSRGTDDLDRATAAFVVANAAVAADQETMVYLSTDAVSLAIGPLVENTGDVGVPFKELMENFVSAGGQIFVNGPCVKRRRLDDRQLVKGASLADPAKLVEFLSDGTPCVSY